VALDVQLANELERSSVEACIRFKPTPVLQARDPKTSSVLSLVGGAVDAQGDFAIKLTGRLDRLRMLAVACGPGG
jgi:hypothetical protein